MTNARIWHRRHGKAGFTLIEILGIIAVLGVLAAILFTVIGRGYNASNRIKCDVNLKALAFGLDAYRQENDFFPAYLQEISTGGYVQDKAIMRCPNDPTPQGTYADYYVIREPRESSDLPILVCPFHEKDKQGGQAYVGRYTTQFMTRPAVLREAKSTTVQHPGEDPVAAPAGLVLHGADRLWTSKNGAAIIDFADGSSAQLKRNSNVTILQSFMEGRTQPTLYTLLRQTAGEANYTVTSGSKFEVTTPAGTAGALGTKFRITIEPNADTTLLVTEGKVRFNNRRGKVKVKNGVPATSNRR